MSNLFELTKRRRRAREFADRFREGATESEREFFDRYYQEPSASPILQRGELQRQLEEGDALRRSLMARGMNAMQAEDAAARAEKAQQTEFETTTKDITDVYTQPGSLGYDSPLGYGGYLTERDESMGQTRPALTEDEFARQRALQMRLARPVSQLAASEVASSTMDASAQLIQDRAEELRAKLPAIKADSNVKEKVNKYIDDAIQQYSATDDPKVIQDIIQRMDNLRNIVDGATRSGSYIGLGHSPADFIKLNNDLENALGNNTPTITGENNTDFRLRQARPEIVESRESN